MYVPQQIWTHCNTLQHAIIHGNTLQHATTNCNTFNSCMYTSRYEHSATSATHYNTPQHTATHCNTLQYTATHCMHIYRYLQRRQVVGVPTGKKQSQKVSSLSDLIYKPTIALTFQNFCHQDSCTGGSTSIDWQDFSKVSDTVIRIVNLAASWLLRNFTGHLVGCHAQQRQIQLSATRSQSSWLQ